ncbi:plasmid mobilization relaxosome protein MobC [Phenylobacterium deserti]|uniref:Plasmid mobilization relaxosome protein MobC n=1 Tax=Phenylobacterium deserti TaxID=1914756 RepID=A0A328ADC7_9CAUL|nr:plasmid mobilization relaxosome protein MobC [Phenylobacterium deserti]RAK52651.1 plasmid mobilization relaxosome protein MobC [Phenylobacterium deserti]
MTVLSTRIPDGLAAQVEALSRPAGGRSAWLAQLVLSAVAREGGGCGAAAGEARRLAGGRSARLMVRLCEADAAAARAAALAMGLSRSAWAAGLVAAHLRGRPCFGRDEARALLAIQGELRRIGVNVNQIARALNVAVLEGRVLELELSAVADLRAELRAQMGGLRAAVAGNLAAWETLW